MNAEEDNKDFDKILERIRYLHHAKNISYDACWRKGTIQNIFDQIDRKIFRYQAFKAGKAGEIPSDTLQDLSIYCIMALQMISEKGSKVEKCSLCGHIKE